MNNQLIHATNYELAIKQRDEARAERDAGKALVAEALAVFDLMLVGCTVPNFAYYQNGDGEEIGARMDALHAALKDGRAAPIQSGDVRNQALEEAAKLVEGFSMQPVQAAAKAIRALASTPSAAMQGQGVPEGWKSMATAPQDGREILIRYPSQGNVKQLVYFQTIHKHWMNKGELVFPESQGCEWIKLPSDEAPSAQPQAGCREDWKTQLYAAQDAAMALREYGPRDADGQRQGIVVDDTQVGLEFAMEWFEKNMLGAAQPQAPMAPPTDWRDVIQNARDSICAGGFAENAQYERSIVEPHLDGVYDELEALEKDAQAAQPQAGGRELTDAKIASIALQIGMGTYRYNCDPCAYDLLFARAIEKHITGTKGATE